MSEPSFDLWLEWEHFEEWDQADPADDSFNMVIILPGGVRYALNVWTYRMLERARSDDQLTGDNLAGAYLLPPDLFVERRDRGLMEAVVRELLKAGPLPEQWRDLEDEDA